MQQSQRSETSSPRAGFKDVQASPGKMERMADASGCQGRGVLSTQR